MKLGRYPKHDATSKCGCRGCSERRAAREMGVVYNAPPSLAGFAVNDSRLRARRTAYRAAAAPSAVRGYQRPGQLSRAADVPPSVVALWDMVPQDIQKVVRECPEVHSERVMSCSQKAVWEFRQTVWCDLLALAYRMRLQLTPNSHRSVMLHEHHDMKDGGADFWLEQLAAWLDRPRRRTLGKKFDPCAGWPTF